MNCNVISANAKKRFWRFWQKSNVNCLIAGMFSSLAFAPVFFFPAIFAIGVIAYYCKMADGLKKSFVLGFYFGFGHFLTSLYWIALAPFVYSQEFWWAVPLALFGIPTFMATFIALPSMLSNIFKQHGAFNLIYALLWVFFEWLRSWLFTGFPWNLMGYCFSFWLPLIQSASIFGVFGLSLIAVYISSSVIYLPQSQFAMFKKQLIISAAIVMAMAIFGCCRIVANPTELSDTAIRIVQPSVAQSQKWDSKLFIGQLQEQIKLSSSRGAIRPEIIVWSEAAVTELIDDNNLLHVISAFLQPWQILMTGAISLEQNQKLYTGMYGINNQAKVTFRYHKRHLVPFGEYIPWQWPFLKKLTPGMVDFTPGRHGQNIVFKDFKIAPLICYEVIFPDEVRVKSRQQDLLLNISNDAWYGNSSGPYQHYYIAQMRAVENGVPLVRAANNGISAIFDALGQVLIKTELNEITYIDAYIPHRLSHSTIYSLHSNILMMFLLISIIFCAVVNKLK